MTRIQYNFPNSGLVMMQGHLMSEGVHVQRQRLREAVARCDPISRRLRWHQVLSRGAYFVPRPNSLWHTDGHHSLIRWRFVIHGGIDGFLCLIVYLRCHTNNRAQSVCLLLEGYSTVQCTLPCMVGQGWRKCDGLLFYGVAERSWTQ